MKRTNVLKTICTLLALTATGCHHSIDINFNRVPRLNIYVPFTTEGVWDSYGAKAPLDARRFIRPSEPAGFPYQDYSFTGYGGVLQLCDLHGTLRAYDLSCPVECQRDVRVVIDYSTNLARCPKCGSTYDVFLLDVSAPLAGAPVSGPALTSGYGLRRFNVVFGVDGRYALITN
ncbi:MAG: hypothetical protein K2O38_08090 [Muribaculaceae bacterium]|nr:hypothetical protein [Muribaculaceae bacterium]MDE7111843.1 hypothetical protein [Muribaculaceae bacterium]